MSPLSSFNTNITQFSGSHDIIDSHNSSSALFLKAPALIPANTQGSQQLLFSLFSILFIFRFFHLLFSERVGKMALRKAAKLDMEGFRNINMTWGFMSHASYVPKADKVLMFLWPELCGLLSTFILLLNA